MAWAPDATVSAISAKCRFIASVLQAGRIRAAPLPCLGQTSPKMWKRCADRGVRSGGYRAFSRAIVSKRAGKFF